MFQSLRALLHRRQAPERYRQLDLLLANAALSRSALMDKQRRDFAAMVAHAIATTPYYSRHFAGMQDVAPESLPILEKEAVRAHLEELLSSQADRAQARIGHTGGSTGQPLAFWYDAAKHELMRAGMMRGFMMSGWRPGQKVLYFWGARHDTARGGVFAGGWGDWIAAEKTIAAVEYSEASLSRWTRSLQTWKPALLYGYASSLTQLARYLLATRAAAPASLIGVYSTAEMLDAEQRAVMQQAFGCKVFNQYGCREVPNIAWECRHGQMHVFADLVYLESRPEDGEDQLLVTSLSNRQMPFIRYRLGDAGRLLEGECECGSPFPLMEMGMCRKNDLIRTGAGKSFHPAVFNRLLYGLTSIRQYQWVQTDLQCMELHLVGPPLAADAAAGIESRLHREVDPAMQLALIYREAIPRSATGKHRFVIGLGG